MAYTSDPQSVEDLLPPPALDDVRAFLLAYLAVPANQIDDWISGGSLRTMWEIESIIIRDRRAGALPGLVANGYPNSASGRSLERLARGWFGVDKAAPSTGTQSVVIACDAGHGPYTAAQVAALAGLASDGARYALTAGAAILGSGSTLTVTFTAESPGTLRGLIVSLQQLAGVTVQSASILTFGSNGDNDATVLAAMDARFPDLSELPTQDRIVGWALAAAPPPLITRYRRDADPAYPGGVLLTLAAAGGPVAGGTVTSVNTAFDNLSGITDVDTAQNSTTHNITPSGTVYVKAALAPRAKAAADADWTATLSGSQIGARFELQTLREVIGRAIRSDPGSNFVGPALAGADPDGNVTLSATEVPVKTGDLSAQLTWVLT